MLWQPPRLSRMSPHEVKARGAREDAAFVFATDAETVVRWTYRFCEDVRSKGRHSEVEGGGTILFRLTACRKVAR